MDDARELKVLLRHYRRTLFRRLKRLNQGRVDEALALDGLLESLFEQIAHQPASDLTRPPYERLVAQCYTLPLEIDQAFTRQASILSGEIFHTHVERRIQEFLGQKNRG